MSKVWRTTRIVCTRAGRENCLLLALRRKHMYRALNFKYWRDYVAARDLSMGYVERLIRAAKHLESDSRLEGLTPERINLVVSAMKRKGSDRTEAQWIAYGRAHGILEIKMELKRLTRAGVLPAGPDPRARTQALKFANRDAAVSLSMQVTPQVKKLFRQQCQAWGLSAAATLLKLLVREGTEQ